MLDGLDYSDANWHVRRLTAATGVLIGVRLHAALALVGGGNAIGFGASRPEQVAPDQSPKQGHGVGPLATAHRWGARQALEPQSVGPGTERVHVSVAGRLGCRGAIGD